MHIIVLVWGNPIILSHRVVGEIGLQLLQRGIVLGQRVGIGRVVAPVGRGEEHLRVVLGGVVVLVAAIVLVAAGSECTREAAERNRVLTLRQDRIVGQVDVGVLLVRPPGLAGGLQVVAQAVGCRLVGTAWHLERVVVIEYT